MAGRTAITSASDLAWTRQANPSQVAHRMQALNAGLASSSITPEGEWKGCSPTAAMSSNSCWMRGSCEIGGKGYGAEAGGSVGSSPRAPCTWYSCSAWV